MQTLHGHYFWTDYVTDTIESFETFNCTNNNLINRTGDLDPPKGALNDVTSFGDDGWGEVYIADRGGQIWRIVPELDVMEVSAPGVPSNRQVLHDATNLCARPAVWVYINNEEEPTCVVARFRPC